MSTQTGDEIQPRTTSDHHAFEASGSIAIDDTDGGILVTCEGSLSREMTSVHAGAEEVHEESSADFDASAVFKPGESRVIVSQGGVKLSLKVATGPES